MEKNLMSICLVLSAGVVSSLIIFKADRLLTHTGVWNTSNPQGLTFERQDSEKSTTYSLVERSSASSVVRIPVVDVCYLLLHIFSSPITFLFHNLRL